MWELSSLDGTQRYSVLLGLQPRFGGNPLKIQVVCSPNGTAGLVGPTPLDLRGNRYPPGRKYRDRIVFILMYKMPIYSDQSVEVPCSQ